MTRTALLADVPAAALPIVGEHRHGNVWLTYRPVPDLARLYHVTERDERVEALEDGLAALTRAATARESRP